VSEWARGFERAGWAAMAACVAGYGYKLAQAVVDGWWWPWTLPFGCWLVALVLKRVARG